jgi:hypothetical protein
VVLQIRCLGEPGSENGWALSLGHSQLMAHPLQGAQAIGQGVVHSGEQSPLPFPYQQKLLNWIALFQIERLDHKGFQCEAPVLRRRQLLHLQKRVWRPHPPILRKDTSALPKKMAGTLSPSPKGFLLGSRRLEF